jgi:hypothetical protein
MAVRSCMSRPGAGLTTIKANGVAGAIGILLACGLAQPSPAAPGAWDDAEPRSVLAQPKAYPASRSRTQTGNAGTTRGLPPGFAQDRTMSGIPGGRVVSDRAANQTYDPAASQSSEQDEGVVIGSPDAVAPGPVGDGYASGDGLDQYGQYQPGYQGPEYQGPMANAAGEPYAGVYDDDYATGQPGPAACGNPACPGCETCRAAAYADPAWRFNGRCEPRGLLQRIFENCRLIDDAGLWTGRADALILYRGAPAFRPLYAVNGGGTNALNANQLESLAAVGPRVSLFRKDAHHCGTSWEGTYIYSGSFVSERTLPPTAGGYDLAAPGIFGLLTPNPQGGLDTATARLVGTLQSAELNRRWALGSCTQLIGGFRWIQWQESLAIADSYAAGTQDFGQDFYNTRCVNDLYGGQLGLDTLLWAPAKCFRLEGLLKAGIYYNNAVQNSSLNQTGAGAPYSAAVGVGQSPASCAFAGELGLTGVVPVCCNWDFRFGYFGLWLTSIAQPANQLSGQVLDQGAPAVSGSLATNGNVVLQGLSLGLEGRW